jgi:hypothetical protein
MHKINEGRMPEPMGNEDSDFQSSVCQIRKGELLRLLPAGRRHFATGFRVAPGHGVQTLLVDRLGAASSDRNDDEFLARSKGSTESGYLRFVV